MAYASEIRSAQGSLADRFHAVTRELGARYGRYKAFRATLNELAGLSNRELNDIGLCRSQIRSIAYEHAYGAK